MSHFRQAFKISKSQAVRWYPGHMNKSMNLMSRKLRGVDCIIEVHDARIPFTGRNPEFQRSITGSGLKPHILVLNKKDYTEVRDRRLIGKQLQNQENIKNVIFTNCKEQQCQGVKNLVPIASELISNSERYHRKDVKDFTVMIIGVPNVGKSSLINVLRNRNLNKKGATQVGANAGVTRSVLERIKISDDPLLYMVDTPGILLPVINDDETGMKLALCGCLPDHIVGEELIADYLLYYLNSRKQFQYLEYIGLKEPTDQIAEVLVAFANQVGVYKQIKQYNAQVITMPDIQLAASKFIKLFRTGKFGRFTLDDDKLAKLRK